MRIALAFVGGDAEAFPMFALALALHDRGHRVVLSAPERYRSTIMKLGFQIVSSGKGFESYLEGWESGDRSEAFARALSADVAVQFVAMRDALREVDVVVGSMLQLAGPSIAEQLKLPYFCAMTSPMVADMDWYPCLGVPFEKSSGIFASRRRAKRRKKWDELLKSTINREREFSHLGPIQDLYRYLFHSGHLLIAVDPDIAQIADDPNRTVTGFWFYDPPEPMDPELETYLSSGPLPIYIDLGRASASRDFLTEFCGELAAAGSRTIVHAAGMELTQADLPVNFRMIESVPDSLLFAHFAAVVHAGNSDVTASAARAGIPQVIAPALTTQGYWARNVQLLGIGPNPVTQLEVGELCRVVQLSMSDPAIREKTRMLGEKIRSRDGLTAAAEAIEKLSEQVGKTA